jgi:hypothetical protein
VRRSRSATKARANSIASTGDSLASPQFAISRPCETAKSWRSLPLNAKFRAELKGSCRPQEAQQYSCYDGDQAELVVTNDEPFNLFVSVVDVGPTMSVDLVTRSTIAVQSNQTARIGPIVFTRPYGRDTLKVIAAREPFDVNLFLESQHLRGVNTLPRNGYWGVADLLVDTSARPGQLAK